MFDNDVFVVDPSNPISQRSLESPTVSLADPSAFDFLGIGTQPISAGVRVDRRTILTLDTWWRGVMLISGTLARLPLHVYKGTRDGNNIPDRGHKAYDLLYRCPNPLLHAHQMKLIMQAHVLNHGNAYAYIVRDGDGNPIEIIPLAPDRTYPIRVNGKLWYISHVYTDITAEKMSTQEPVPTTMVKIPPEDMLHIKGLGFDGLVGYTVFDLAAESVGHALATRQYAARFFANNAEPRVVIELPAGVVWKPEIQQEFLRQWNMMHAGVSNAHRTALLTGGAKLNPFSINVEKAQLVEQRKFSVREISNWLGVPPHKLGDDSRSSYNSLEMENLAWLSDCLAFWLDVWGRECEMKLLKEKEQRGYTHYIGFDTAELLRGDNKTEADALSMKVNNGLITLDEARGTMNKPPAPDGMGASFRCPVNIGILTKDGVKGIQQSQGDMKRPEGNDTPADQLSAPAAPERRSGPEDSNDVITPEWLQARYAELDALGVPGAAVDLLAGLTGKPMGTLNNHRVVAVDGDAVMQAYEALSEISGDESAREFSTAGNHAKYAWMPEGDYWVEEKLTIPLKSCLHDLLHEAVEQTIMDTVGWSYDDAHEAALDYEMDYMESTWSNPVVDLVVQDAAERVHSRLTKDAQRHATAEKYAAWVEGIYEAHQAPVTAIVTPAMAVLAASRKKPINPQDAKRMAYRLVSACAEAHGDDKAFNLDTIINTLKE
jgi:HK97 family phage portal protein